MELLTKKLFEQWMETILERLERQDEMLLALKAPEKREHTPDRIRLFDNQDLCLLLQISKRSLQRYRSTGALPYKILGKKTYYRFLLSVFLKIWGIYLYPVKEMMSGSDPLSEMREPHLSRWIRSGMSGLILASEREVTSSILPEN